MKNHSHGPTKILISNVCFSVSERYDHHPFRLKKHILKCATHCLVDDVKWYWGAISLLPEAHLSDF